MTDVEARTPVRERLLDAAQDVIEKTGWSSVKMAGIADIAGVSRQTVYNEFGTKHGLAQQLVFRELDRFLAVVRDRMAVETDIVVGLASACEGVLLMGEQSLIVRTIVGTQPDEHDTDLLQLLTTESGEVIDSAVLVVKECIHEFYPPLPFTEAELDVALEVIVRLVLSAITRPAKPPHEAAADIAWIVALVLKGAAAS
ncbi:MAG: TetR family transcriptional regulator [Aeromicrobium sp.]